MEEFLKKEIKQLLDWKGQDVGCIVSDKITKEGYKVGYMYREKPLDNPADSGWRFLAGNENKEYMNNPDNHHIFKLNTICNYDEDIIPYLKNKYGSSFIRISKNKFEKDDRTKDIYIDKNN